MNTSSTEAMSKEGENSKRDQLTLVIPTKNRSILLENQLKYYANMNFPYGILYVDASDPQIYQKNVEAVNSLSQRLACRIVRATPKMDDNPARRINRQLIDHAHEISSEFVCQTGDDDFLMINGVEAAISALASDSSLAGCGGHCLLATTKSSKHPNLDEKSVILGNFRASNLVADNAFERVHESINHFGNISYAIKRRDIWHRTLIGFDYGEMEGIMIEMLMGAVAVAHGKVRRLEKLLLIRHQHHRNDETGRQDDSFDILHPHFAARVAAFTEAVLSILADADAPRPSNAETEITNAFKFQVLKKAWRFVRQNVQDWPPPQSEPSVEAILASTGSPAETQRVYDIIADNTLRGLSSPQTNSFNSHGS
jgi:glycosyltransferase domain-containing protein